MASPSGWALDVLWHVVGHGVRDPPSLTVASSSSDPSWNHQCHRLALTKLSPPHPFLPLLLKGKGTGACHPCSHPTRPCPRVSHLTLWSPVCQCLGPTR